MSAAPTTTIDNRPRRPVINAAVPANAGPGTRPAGKLTFGPVATGRGRRIGLYGPGGIGKSTLACQLPGPLAYFDIDNSLPRLHAELEAAQIMPQVVQGVNDWNGLRDALHADGWDCIKTIVIDSLTAAEEMAVMWTLNNVLTDKGAKIDRLEDYGYGKGERHLYDSFLPLLADLEVHSRAGRHICLICHDIASETPNPLGEDYKRWEPRLSNAPKSSIRLRVREWLDDLLFVGYDVLTSMRKDGKVKVEGCGTRTMYPREMPYCMAKSTLSQPIPVVLNDRTIWQTLLGAY